MTPAEIRDQIVLDLLVLRDLHGVAITQGEARERANNIAQWVGALIDEARDEGAANADSVARRRPPFVPREVASVRNVRCDTCETLIGSDGVTYQVDDEPRRMFRHFHRRCLP